MLILAAAVALLVMLALASPVAMWRTGEVRQPDLRYLPPSAGAEGSARVWIDADAASGTGIHRDPDDCLALLSLASAPKIRMAGISTWGWTASTPST